MRQNGNPWLAGGWRNEGTAEETAIVLLSLIIGATLCFLARLARGAKSPINTKMHPIEGCIFVSLDSH